MDLSKLHAPFPRDAVSWRIQGTPTKRKDGSFAGMALSYIDARDVMDRLDEVCGSENWQTEYTETAKGRVIGRIGIRVDAEWVWKSDGAGDTDVEGEKGGISDALKRAAVLWGIGRYLYRLDAPWCPCEVNERGEKVYFRKWIGSPWDHIKAAPRPAFDPDGCLSRLLAGIAKRPTKQLLRTFWDDEADARTSLKAAAPEKYRQFHDAFKAVGEKAHDDPAMQAAHPDDREAA